MSAKPLEPKKSAPVEAIKAMFSKEDEALQRKVLSDSLNSEKAKKDVQLMTVAQLEGHIIELRAKFDGLAQEYNQKNAVNANLGSSIQSAHNDLAQVKALFDKKNAEMLAELTKKLKDVNEADGQYQAMLKEVTAKSAQLEQERSTFHNERENNRQLVASANEALAQNNVEWKKREADILQREEALKDEKIEFELYKASLSPEIKRITSIKNENELLLKKVEMQNAEMERRRIEAENSKQIAEEASLASKAQAQQERQRIQNEEARLRKWEQDLKDSALELRVKQTEADKIIYREKLQAEVERHESAMASKEKK
jgi:hypothetical protein